MTNFREYLSTIIKKLHQVVNRTMSKIRILNPNEYEDGLKVFVKAMKFEDESMLFRLEMACKFYNKEGMFTAIGLFENDKIRGFGSISLRKNDAWIPFVGVDPDVQGKGFGRLIMVELLRLAEENGNRTVELCASKAGYPLYEKIGFQFEYNAYVYELKEPKVRLDTSDLEILIVKKSEKFPNWVLDLDKEIIGIDRKDYMNLQWSDEATVIGKPNIGYGLLISERIGPIVSKDNEIAKKIILKAKELGAKNIILIEESQRENVLHQAMELEESMRTYKMTWGELPNQPYDQLFAIRSPGLG